MECATATVLWLRCLLNWMLPLLLLSLLSFLLLFRSCCLPFLVACVAVVSYNNKTNSLVYVGGSFAIVFLFNKIRRRRMNFIQQLLLPSLPSLVLLWGSHAADA